MESRFSKIFGIILSFFLGMCTFSEVPETDSNQAPSLNEIPPNYMDTTIVSTYLTQTYDQYGNVVHKYGMDGKPADPNYFQAFMTYDSLNRLTSRTFYSLGEDNINCIIHDSLDYFETRFFYNKDGLERTEGYYQVKKNGKIVGHSLRYVTNEQTGKTEWID